MLVTHPTPPFTREALEILFARAPFRAFQKIGYMSHYWAPLLSVCSGASRNEIFFLQPADIFQKHGVWIMHLKARSEKNGGPGKVSRDIPLHPILRQLGWLEFVHQRRQTHPNERLFSEYKASQEQAGVVFSRSFVHWIKTTVEQLPAEKKGLWGDDFHFPSLRALFCFEAIRSGMSAETLRKIQGLGDDSRRDLTEEQEQHNLQIVATEIERMDIAAYFPPLYSYEELMG